MATVAVGKATLDAGAVRRITGVSRRQLEHWVMIGLVWPCEPSTGRGRAALFDRANIEWILTVRDLVALGMEPARLKAQVAELGAEALATRLIEAAERLRSEHVDVA